jgi:hypothetical protein
MEGETCVASVIRDLHRAHSLQNELSGFNCAVSFWFDFVNETEEMSLQFHWLFTR